MWHGAILAIACLAVPAAGYYGRIANPIPVVQSLSPTSLAAGMRRAELTIAGKNFVTTSNVSFNGMPRSSALVDPGDLRMILQPGDISEPGTFPIVVTNPAPGGGSATAQITVKPSH